MSRIKFKIDKPGSVKLIILNLIGMKLDELRAGYMREGEHILAWKSKFNLSGSVLNYRVELDEKIIEESLFVAR
ncbi:MAG: hypothetical protein L0Y79_00880 [Chlorobi bacterium]|nr:hypothetical protein [Chlorobiota bacterium]MCI0715043.1 hypothetical protein [Chlorobiota bacterium]